MIAGPNWRQWFAAMWPAAKRDVLAHYAAVGMAHKPLLADLALRAGLYSVPGRDLSEAQRAYDDGRRSLALETIALCNATPAQLLDLVERPVKENRT